MVQVYEIGTAGEWQTVHKQEKKELEFHILRGPIQLLNSPVPEKSQADSDNF